MLCVNIVNTHYDQSTNIIKSYKFLLYSLEYDKEILKDVTYLETLVMELGT